MSNLGGSNRLPDIHAASDLLQVPERQLPGGLRDSERIYQLVAASNVLRGVS
jgi:hypothetical protein